LYPTGQLWHGFLLNLASTLFVTSLYESTFFREWKTNIQRAEAGAAASRASWPSSKASSTSHFLFNSLNTLDHAIALHQRRGPVK
jgi:hypothetical protein